jgi:hypothetical protein
VIKVEALRFNAGPWVFGRMRAGRPRSFCAPWCKIAAL